jgi:hypothetical protein
MVKVSWRGGTADLAGCEGVCTPVKPLRAAKQLMRPLELLRSLRYSR